MIRSLRCNEALFLHLQAEGDLLDAHIPQDRYYHIIIGQNKKVFELRTFG